MGLFKEIYCAHCGAKTKLLTRMKLNDGTYLCSRCAKAIPSEMLSTAHKGYDLEDYHALLEYINFSNTHLRPLFHETHSYYTIHIDTEHKILYFGYSIDEETVFYHFHNLDDFTLVFRAEELKEGLLGDKVTGKVLMTVKMAHPYFYYEEILDHSAKAKAKQKLLSSRIEYENPKGMDEFILFFQTAWNASIYEAENAQYQQADNPNYPAIADDLQQAMTLFMLDSLDNVTLEDIKAHRNRLIKAFHPDKGSAADTAYAQKINNAYEIIKQYLQ